MAAVIPDPTAVRVALWRALHLEVDAGPPVLEDRVGLELAAPDEGWRARPDMNPEWTKLFRASILARARFIEDLVREKAATQYVLLGAGLDTFAQRHASPAVRVFEIDQPATQAWKRKRLVELGYGVPDSLRLVPVDFENGASWPVELRANGFDDSKPAVVASTGVSMYLTREANAQTLRDVASLAPGTTFAMTFTLPLDLVSPEVRVGFERAMQGAAAAGTPFRSLFTPEEMLHLAHECGFQRVEHVSSKSLADRYFQGRTDGLRPPDRGEELLVATT